MNPIEELKQEHREIERELIELETIIEEDEINHSNLAHTFSKLIKIWNLHERKEELLFPILEKSESGIRVPVKQMLFEHQRLRPHRDSVEKAINSESEYEIKKALKENATIIVNLLGAHINFEDEILYTTTSGAFNEKELNNLWENMLKEKFI